MRFYLLISLVFLAVLNSFSSGNEKLKMPDYAEKINQIVFRLSCDANDRQAAKKLIKTYSAALTDYQKELGRLQLESDSFKWSKSYNLMDEFNGLSNEIRYNSAASRVICEPKFYDDELPEVKQKAVHELYNAGIHLLQIGTKRKSKEAYSCFEKAYQLSPAFSDVYQKIQEAKNSATVNVVIEKVTAYADQKSLFSTRFYQTLINKLQSEFLNDQFVNIFSFTDAKQRKIDPAAWYIRISFIDFEMGELSTFDQTKSININGVAEIRIFVPAENKDILNTRISGQYVWKSYQNTGSFDLQSIFDSYSMSMTDRVDDLLSGFIKQSN